MTGLISNTRVDGYTINVTFIYLRCEHFSVHVNGLIYIHQGRHMHSMQSFHILDDMTVNV